MERAEEDFYRENNVLKCHSIPPRKELFIIYTSPLRRGDVAVVELWLDEARTRAVRYRFRIINEDTGKRIVVSINYFILNKSLENLFMIPVNRDIFLS